MKRAALFNTRAKDAQWGGRISRGTIVGGLHGYVVAEADVENVTALKPSLFQPNGRCSWSIWELDCMCVPGAPVGKPQMKGRNYIVAELTTEEMVQAAANKGVPVIEAGERKLVNLEIDRFSGQHKGRLATLV